MSEIEALQAEEREVLSSIYEGDDCFKQIDTKTFQYKYGISETSKTFILELKWGESYPEQPPEISMDVFYNKHIHSNLKTKICDLVRSESEQYLGMSMTYSLFEFVKEKFEELIEEQCENIEADVEKIRLTEENDESEEVAQVKKEKKEQLTKAQKRRQWNRLDSKGEKPRGWNWIDIVKHLSQTGSKEDNPMTSS